jgi:MoxR-like ATPase
MLAEEVAQALDLPLLQWHIKSTTKAQQGLYEYDAVSRLRDSQLKDVEGGEKVKDIHNYIVKGVLWQAFTAEQPVALLIDEIDKADIEFPNDLLRELDRMEFYVYETRELVKARHRPLVFITSNNEKELPDAFLRRCFFHYIKFPDADTMKQIVGVHFPGPEEGPAHLGDEDLLRRAQPAGPEEEAQHVRAARLAEAAGGRGHPARGAAKQGREGGGAAAGGRPAEERTGRDAVREARLHAAQQPLIEQPCTRCCSKASPTPAASSIGALLGFAIAHLLGIDPMAPTVTPPARWGIALVGIGGGRPAPGAPLARGTPQGADRAQAGTRHPVGRPRAAGSDAREHAPGLEAAAADGELWNLRVTSCRRPAKPRLRRRRAQGPGRRPHAALRGARRQGTRARHHPLPRHRAGRGAAGDRLHLVRQALQRTTVNTTCKLLLLTHAFETLGAQLVGWRTDNFNFASQRAIERLGAKKDGVLRHHALRRDGTVRDTVMYSLAAGEWPEVKAHLQDLLARPPR